MQELTWLANRRRRTQELKEYGATDYGRRYGWWLCLDDERVADLNYWRYDIDMQFWHEYRVYPTSPRFLEVGFDPNRWCSPNVALQSRYAIDYRSTNVLMASLGASSSGDLISLRSLHVPEDVFLATLRGEQRESRQPTPPTTASTL